MAIMYHPARNDFILDLYRNLADADHKVSIITDTKSEGTWTTAFRAWQDYDPLATHHIVLQDDVAVCRDFALSMEKAIDTIGLDKPVSPFCSYKAVLEAKEQGKAWVTGGNAIWGAALCLPIDLVKSFIEWGKRHNDKIMADPLFRMIDDDWLMLHLLHLKRHKIWVTVPSLCEHLGAGKSLLKHNNRTVAKWFIGRTVSGLSVDWTQGVEKPVRAGSGPTMSYFRGRGVDSWE